MAKDALAKFAIDRARSIVSPDGELELKDVRDNVAYVRYRLRKSGSECAQCAVGPNDLKDFLHDVFEKTAPHIKGFDIEYEEIST
jgi:hypothetical protein